MAVACVWATRPAHQNAAWQAQLSALGCKVLALPLLDIVPLTGNDETQRIKQHVLKLDEYQHVLFVSQNAVAEAFRWFEDYWPQLPVGIYYYGVGAKTAKSIAAFGVPVLEAGAAMNSEALLALPELQDVRDSKILICRGQGGRPKLGEELAARGAKVDYLELYQRAVPQGAGEALANIDWQQRHVIPLFSGETLQNLLSILPQTVAKARVKLVVPAEHVAGQARQAGFAAEVAQNASEQAMLAATAKVLNEDTP